MKCAHCLVEFHPEEAWTYLGNDADGHWAILQRTCPACNRFIVALVLGEPSYIAGREFYQMHKVKKTYLVRPKAASRSPCPKEVPADLARDYYEACLVLSDSPKASAALSRRCLQQLLRDYVKVKPSSLASEIEEFIQKGGIPSHIVEMVDAVRNIGNFAAHPMKSQKSGEIIPVEPGEAEWNLDVLESLFDFIFVQPEVIKKKKQALNHKLSKAGKPLMK